MSHPFLINLSFLAAQPTGHTVYAKNLVSHLQSLAPTLLTAQEFTGFQCYSIPGNMTPDRGSKGHLSRLIWTQFQLPNLCKTLKSKLLFSPIPEAPLFSKTHHVVTLHDLIPLKFPRKTSPLTPYFKYYIPQVLSQAKQVICDSEATAKDAASFYQISAQKMTVIPLAYDSHHFRFLDLPTQNYFLYIGRHDAYKNLQRSIEAFSKLPDHSSYEFWIAGSPDRRYTPMLTAQIAALGLTQQIKFLSYVAYADLPTLINQAIALVFPSLCEGFGLPILEAMACGTPVVTSNLSSMPEVAGEAALLVDPYRVEAIAEAMGAIVTHSTLRSRLRQLSLIQASQFSWAKTAKATADVLQPFL
ncbi:MAG: glycosyltransferase family 4 protein [Leptolyngbyaceae cyanobacterium CSU_1_3]|nr:glycosyltransferase family 4 protein [Leptolyngbyaceae cyanobacterium CSU_1_3]